ncbi:hypothetical protein JYU34_021098, partial [Plutella xylostella]
QVMASGRASYGQWKGKSGRQGLHEDARSTTRHQKLECAPVTFQLELCLRRHNANSKPWDIQFLQRGNVKRGW